MSQDIPETISISKNRGLRDEIIYGKVEKEGPPKDTGKECSSKIEE